MKHLRKFNESIDSVYKRYKNLPITIGELVGNPEKQIPSDDVFPTILTDKGVIVYGLELYELEDTIRYGEKFKIYKESNDQHDEEVILLTRNHRIEAFLYYESGDNKILSTIPGDYQGYDIEGDNLVVCGHDGQYSIDINTGTGGYTDRGDIKGFDDRMDQGYYDH